jgi:hypothetical protein
MPDYRPSALIKHHQTHRCIDRTSYSLPMAQANYFKANDEVLTRQPGETKRPLADSGEINPSQPKLKPTCGCIETVIYQYPFAGVAVGVTATRD